MKVLAIIWVVFIVCGLAIGGGVYWYVHRPADVPNDKIAALQELRDTGVISAQDYDARVQALQAAAPAAPAASVSGSASATPASAALASSSPFGAMQSLFAGTRTVQIPDPVYQTTAYTLEIPGNWKFAGDIVRAPDCHSGGAGLRFTAQSADGLSASVHLPPVFWHWSNNKMAANSRCPNIDIDTASSFLLNIAIPNIRPKAKIVAVLPLLPEGQAALKDQAAKSQEVNNQLAQRYGNKPPKISLDGARVRLAYQRDGHAIEEMITVVISCTESTMGAMFNQPAFQQRTCTTRGVNINRAPQGQLDALLASADFTTMTKSLKANPDWQKRIDADQQAEYQKMADANKRQAEANLKQGRDQTDAMLARGRAFQQQQRQSTDNALAADRARQAAIDESAHRTALYSLDRQEFRNPNTGQVIEASNQYNHQWLSSDGSTLIQNNDHTFDPNGVVNPISQSWVELVAK